MVAEAERLPARDGQKYWKEFEANDLNRIEIVGDGEDRPLDTTPPPDP